MKILYAIIMRFVIDGAPGSGKTTILFGRTADEKGKIQIPCLSDYGFKIIPESITSVADDMRNESKVPTDCLDEFIARTIKKSINESLGEYDFCILERGLPGDFFIEEVFGKKMPEEYHKFCELVQYESPIFILEPIRDFDMSPANKNLRKGRVATLEQRINFFKKTKEIYKSLGYEIEVIPNYDKDIYINTEKRIKHIMNFIKNV